MNLDPWRRPASQGPADKLAKGMTQDSAAVTLTLPEGIFKVRKQPHISW